MSRRRRSARPGNMSVPGRLLLTGSYNWTVSAGAENDENILVTGSPRLVERFARNFESLWRRLS